MPKPALLSTGYMMPLVVEQLEDQFEAHWLHKISDKDAFFKEVGPRVVAVSTGAHTAVKTDEAMMARLPKLRIVGNYGVGYDSIELPAANKRGIIVTNTPEVLTEEVADTAVGLLLATIREFNHAEAYLRAGEWPKKGEYRFTESLRDRKVGLIGYGRIGKSIGRRLEAFGVPLVYFGRKKQADVSLPFYNDLVAMARDVDTLVAILPRGPSTANLVNAQVLEALGPRGIFINMARGTVADEPALIQALKAKTIHSAGLDVYWNEPNFNPEFLKLDNVTLLPHVGSASQHTRNKMGQLMVDNLVAFKNGASPLTPVPETPFKSW
jgi:lactate dehydrogenase-like 2-hydroxyacid dehydrogenase